MIDKIVGGHITLVPCGLNENKEVMEADVVINGELYHVARESKVMDLLNWVQERLYKKSMEGVFIGPNGGICKRGD